jgi:hypothetical protein
MSYSEQGAYFCDFQALVSRREFCRDEECPAWFCSEVDTWHECPCNATKRVPHPESYECEGPDEGDAESGPPDSIDPCCPKHFPHLDFGAPSDADDIPF